MKLVKAAQRNFPVFIPFRIAFPLYAHLKIIVIKIILFIEFDFSQDLPLNTPPAWEYFQDLYLKLQGRLIKAI
ncbi:MAG: hypothetical protein MZV64_27205 [Ignavibacteriales bacterium]|nr:hypothetical protein [Ignavibacteriales bacterium]